MCSDILVLWSCPHKSHRNTDTRSVRMSSFDRRVPTSHTGTQTPRVLRCPFLYPPTQVTQELRRRVKISSFYRRATQKQKAEVIKCPPFIDVCQQVTLEWGSGGGEYQFYRHVPTSYTETESRSVKINLILLKGPQKSHRNREQEC